MNEQDMIFHIPEGPEILRAFGTMSLRHTNLDHILKMTIKTLAGIEMVEALDATAFESSTSLRERIKKIARQRLGEGPALLRVQALMERCRRATELRNRYMHSVWAEDWLGEAQMRRENHEWGPIPTVAELDAVSTELVRLVQEINEARLRGIVAEALLARNAELGR
jgi:hypothetical protein